MELDTTLYSYVGLYAEGYPGVGNGRIRFKVNARLLNVNASILGIEGFFVRVDQIVWALLRVI